MPRYAWAPLSRVRQFESEAAMRGVSAVARSKKGFLTQYKKAGGAWTKLDPWWVVRRNNFVERHMAQAKKRKEKLWSKDKGYSRRGLALMMWAYDPKGKR